jgi:hypothetical protein
LWSADHSLRNIALERRPREARIPEYSCPMSHATAIRLSLPGPPTRTALHPTSLYRGREGLRCQKCDHSPNSAVCVCRWSRTWLRKAHCNASAASDSDTRSVNAGTRPGASRVGAPTSLEDELARGKSLSPVVAGESHGELPVLY